MNVRIKSKTRFIVSVTIIVLILLTGVNFITGKMDVEAITEYKYIEVTVESGDTVWNLAKQHKPADMEIRNYVYLICKYNNLDNAGIKPGQKIIMPN